MRISRQSHRARLRVALLASSALIAAPAAAQDRTWLANPGSADFNTAGNWDPASVPLGIAIFGNSNTTTLSFSASRNMDGFRFEAGAPAYTFNMTTGFGVAFHTDGIINNSSNTPTFNVNNSPLRFDDSSTAGNAIINLLGGTVEFLIHGTAGSAQLNASAGTLFDFTATAGPSGAGAITAGSIAGAGNFALGTNALTVGSNNLSTAVSGVISGNGASLTKIGTGTLTLSNANTYTGGTMISGGTIVANSVNAGTVDALGFGNVTMDGGKLRVDVTGDVQNSITFNASKTSTLSAAAGQTVTLVNSVTLAANATAQFGSATDTGTIVYAAGATVDPTASVVVAGGRLKDSGSSLVGLTFAAASTTVNAGAVLDFDDAFNQAIHNLKGNGSVVTGVLGGTTLNLYVDNNGSSTFGGTISGAGTVQVQTFGITAR